MKARNDNLTPKVALRKENAVEEVSIRRIRDGRRYWRCGRYLFGTTHCFRPAMFIVDTGKTGFAYCFGCLAWALRDRLIAPDEEYVEESRAEFDRSMISARKAAHSGCTGYSKGSPDGLCHAPVVAICRHTCGLKCARHAVRCRKRHGLEAKGSGRVELPGHDPTLR